MCWGLVAGCVGEVPHGLASRGRSSYAGGQEWGHPTLQANQALQPSAAGATISRRG